MQGIPKLYLEESLGQSDKELRDRLYDAFFGRFYGFMMPFVLLPTLTLETAKWLWAAYFAIVAVPAFSLYRCAEWAFHRGFETTGPLDVASLVALALCAAVFWRHPPLAKLLAVAVPLKILTILRPFRAAKGAQRIHLEAQESYRNSPDKMRLLDVAAGSCNALVRYGWTDLDAEFVAADLSETMLARGMRAMAKRNLPIDFVLAAAQRLPFESESFDVVTCYGAVNAFTDVAGALEEMARVTKPGGRILFLDEQIQTGASWLERVYFHCVLASHDAIHGCPLEMLPESLEDIEVHQVYRFYYLCTARKKDGIHP